MEPRTEEFYRLSKEALEDTALRQAIAKSNSSFQSSRSRAIEEIPEWEQLRDRAMKIKDEALAHLPEYLEALEERIQARGGKVHWAETGERAAEIITSLARRRGVKLAVKSKSMVSEEINLNEALTRAGVEPVETDLGEYIVQLAGETPSHIITPAIHKSREQIARLLHEKLGSPVDADIPQMTRVAREALREKFLSAELGITGVNFAVAETGTLVVVENEGNARFCTTLPRVHVAVMGIEKVVPRVADLAVLLRILCRSATGQAVTSYFNFVGGPTRSGEGDGPEELHLILLDGGRSRMWADPHLREVLRCIRCGACLNFCPVFERIGGHAYGSVYSGPIGAVITPEMVGIDRARELPHASSLCGRCGEVCPVKIPLPELLIVNRSHEVERGDPGPPASERRAMRLFAFAVRRPWLFRLGGALLRFYLRRKLGRNPAAGLPGPLASWTRKRNFPRPGARTFRSLWGKIER